MELNETPYSMPFDRVALSEKDAIEKESDNFFRFTISYPENRKNYYAVIFRELEKDGWVATKGCIIGNEISTTFKKIIWEYL